MSLFFVVFVHPFSFPPFSFSRVPHRVGLLPGLRGRRPRRARARAQQLGHDRGISRVAVRVLAEGHARERLRGRRGPLEDVHDVRAQERPAAVQHVAVEERVRLAVAARGEEHARDAHAGGAGARDLEAEGL